MKKINEVRYNLKLHDGGLITICEICVFDDLSQVSTVCYHDDDRNEYIGKRVSKALSQWILLKERYGGKR